MIKKIKSIYSVDMENIYLLGFSYGGSFALYLGLSHPEKFKGIACVAGLLNTARQYIGKINLSSKNEKHIPVLIYIGLSDKREMISDARQTRNELKRYGYVVEYEEFPGVQHAYKSWYSEKIWNWFEGEKETVTFLTKP